jgi:Skp family chaperone for outer membrane proteins
MNMKYTRFAMVVLLATLGLAGCDRAQKPSISIVDLDLVATKLGNDREILAEIEKKRGELDPPSLARYQIALVQNYREKLRPITKMIAAERGCNIVLTKNDTVVFAYDDAVDITDATVAYINEHAP